MERMQDDRVIKAMINFPYFVLNEEIEKGVNFYRQEIREINQNYIDYENGVRFVQTGTSGDYVPSDVPFKHIKTLIDKEARFMFSQTPDVNILASNVNPSDKQMAKNFQIVADKILEKCNFSKKLLQSAKDCFIGKRIAILVDVSEDDGIQAHFYTSLQFYYETDSDSDRLVKFVSFEKMNDSLQFSDVEYLVNKYVEIDRVVYMSSTVYDSAGKIIDELIPMHETQLKYIPAVVITNDGTLQQKRGVSEVEDLCYSEYWYSKTANADVDAVGKNMNPIRYTVDMNPKTTKNLPSSAGSYWDLQHDQNINEPQPQIGVLAPTMQHTEAIKSTLERIKTSMYNSVDVPDITAESISGVITSGKALKALYFPLTVRCNEKLKTWVPALKMVIRAVVDLAILNEDLIKEFYVIPDISAIEYNVNVVVHYALVEDTQEEKASDLSEIAANARSRKSYIRKWRSDEFTTDEQIDEELMQIAIEQNMFDTMSINTSVQTKLNEDDSKKEVDNNIDKLEVKETLEEN